IEDVPLAAQATPRQGTLALENFPAWLRTPAPRETPADILLRPSDAAENDGEGRGTVTDETRLARERALRRGTLIHRLLQSLPDVAVERRDGAARDFLQRNAHQWFTN
ncbi:hypothetical protein, partial [Escherichia coli]|uniref:hypothetical protein n=1 Tax=Escherichia coli TaxID=562 RepID=UPI003CE52DFB